MNSRSCLQINDRQRTRAFLPGSWGPGVSAHIPACWIAQTLSVHCVNGILHDYLGRVSPRGVISETKILWLSQGVHLLQRLHASCSARGAPGPAAGWSRPRDLQHKKIGAKQPASKNANATTLLLLLLMHSWRPALTIHPIVLESDTAV